MLTLLAAVLGVIQMCRRRCETTPAASVAGAGCGLHDRASRAEPPATGTPCPAPANALATQLHVAATRDVHALEHLQAVYTDLAHAAVALADPRERGSVVQIERAVHVLIRPMVEKLCDRIELSVFEADVLDASTLRPPAP